jgi:hypothetical protein
MKNITLFPILIFLISCGGGSDNPVVSQGITCDKNGSFDSTNNPSAIKFSFLDLESNSPLPGVVVQIDHKGSCVVSNAKGNVTFDTITPGLHDIHVFAPSGYSWSSYYNVDTTSGFSSTYKISKVDRNYSEPVVKSNIRYKGRIQGSLNNSRINVIKFSETDHIYGFPIVDRAPVTSYSVQYKYEDTPGTAVTNDLWFLENAFDFITEDLRLVDVVHVPEATVNTTDTAAFNSIDVTFRSEANKPAESNLVTINSMIFPVGISFDGLSISGPLTKTYSNSSVTRSIALYTKRLNNLTLPKTFTSYIVSSSNVNSLDLSVYGYAGDNYDSFWSYNSNFKFDGVTIATIDVKPKFDSTPQIISNQTGSTITWNNYGANIPLLKQRLYISSTNFNDRLRWSININGNQNKIVLPVIPNGLKPLLNSGNKYNVSLDGYYEYVLSSGEKIIENTGNFSQWTR